MLDEKEEDEEAGSMERRIVSFRMVGNPYRRTDEVHRVRLYGSDEITAGKNRAAFVARRP